MMKKTLGLIGVAAMALTACQQGGGTGASSGTRDTIRIVGSSTVYPFTTAVAEQFQRKNPSFKAPIVESTGTGGGMKLFCAGVGAQHPDIANASRRIKKSELDDCAKNGVKEVIELQIGIDGLAIAESKEGQPIKLTQAEVYQALAASPYGKPQTAKTWKDVNPELPAIAIEVYGPPPTSGTRDSFNELILEQGCDANPEMKALKTADKDKHKDICTRIREDGAFIESGENDNLIVQKLAANPNAIGVFGYSFLEENFNKLRGVALNGVAPSAETITDFTYPGARKMFIYAKGAHVNVIPGLKQFLAEYASAWNDDGYLTRRGLIPSPLDERTKNSEIAKNLTPIDPASVE